MISLNNITWLEKEDLTRFAVREMRTVDVVLDIGCGIMPQNYILPKVHICCEPFDEYVSHLQNKTLLPEKKDRHYQILNMGWDDVVKFFPPQSVDTIFLVDVIEHLDKDVGEKLLLATQKIARKQVVVFTPLGFMPQHHDDGKDAWGLNGANWQEHKSGWMPEDFVGDGWRFFASREFHDVDSSSRKLEKPFGAFWAIKSNVEFDSSVVLNHDDILKNLAMELNRRELAIHEQQEEMNSLITPRVERKCRKIFEKLLSNFK